VEIIGEVDAETLREIISYVERTGLWKWDPLLRKFFPVEEA
jgi:hypothetical protein